MGVLDRMVDRVTPVMDTPVVGHPPEDMSLAPGLPLAAQIQALTRPEKNGD